MGDLNQKENKEIIISMIVIRDFKLGRDSTKEENTKEITWMRGKVEYEDYYHDHHHDNQHYHYYRHHHDDHQTGT